MSPLPIVDARLQRAHVDSSPSSSPFACLPESTMRRRAGTRLLTELSAQLEEEALARGASAIVATTFPDARRLTGRTAERYRDLVGAVSLVCVFAAGIDAEPILGARSAMLAAGGRSPASGTSSC